MAMLIGACIGVVLHHHDFKRYFRNGRIKAEYEQYIAELELRASAGFGRMRKTQCQYQRWWSS